MNTKEYVKTLFTDYEETEALLDFMEELQVNLDDRIASMVKKGLPEKAAFEKAASELGDVSALADEISRNRRKEVFEERYLDIRHYMKTGRIISYIVFGALLVFGFVFSFITYFALTGSTETGVLQNAPNGPSLSGYGNSRLELEGVFGVFFPFFTAAAAGFTFLGFTQETSSLYPMKRKRALWYSTAAGLIAFGVSIYPLVLFSAGGWEGRAGGLASAFPFVLSGAGILAFLILTEKCRLKPWALETRLEIMRKNRR
ncbi:MAG: permease prefix domain 1-containing protein [Treponema sp.]|jgi:hypothetical protein|nr:permease prefix domain 1-containing protein [Treponema sp.]